MCPVSHILSPSWKTNSFSSSQEIPTISWCPQIYYRVYTAHHLSVSAAPLIQSAPILFPINHFNIILPITPRFSKWSPVRFRHQNSVRISRVIIWCMVFALHSASLSSTLLSSPHIHTGHLHLRPVWYYHSVHQPQSPSQPWFGPKVPGTRSIILDVTHRALGYNQRRCI